MVFERTDPTSLAESLLGFWADAGVDALIGEATVNRLAESTAPARTAARPVQAPSRPAPARSQDAGAGLDAARAAAAAANTLEELEAAIAAFEGCPLRFEGARRAVFARGEPRAPVMIIGEAPGADEDRQGAPFVGRAGQLLDRMIESAGLGGRVFITNTVFWRPPGNRTPTPVEQAVCSPFLERAIALVAPQALLLAGGAAAKSVLGKTEGILTLRGQWFDWLGSSGGPALPAMPTLHPAFLLRQPIAKKKAWRDFLAVAERTASAPPRD